MRVKIDNRQPFPATSGPVMNSALFHRRMGHQVHRIRFTGLFPRFDGGCVGPSHPRHLKSGRHPRNRYRGAFFRGPFEVVVCHLWLPYRNGSR